MNDIDADGYLELDNNENLIRTITNDTDYTNPSNNKILFNMNNGLDGIVYSLDNDNDGNVYIGGNFNNVNNSKGLVYWNGNSFKNILDFKINDVISLKFNNSSNVLYFTGFNPISGTNISMWNKNTEIVSGINNGPNDTINILEIANTDLFVGGQFQFVNNGSTEVNYIAKYDTVSDTWSALSNNGLNNGVRALLFDSNTNTLYVGGDFTELGDGTTGYNHIASYNLNTNTWSTLGTGLDNSCYSLGIDSQGSIYAGGNFNSVGGITTGPIAKWDGTNWSAIANGNTIIGTVLSIDIDSNDIIYAGGDFNLSLVYFNFIFYINNEWKFINRGFNSIVNSILIVDNEINIGGSFTSIIDNEITLNRVCKLSDKYVILNSNNDYVSRISKNERQAILISNLNGYKISN